MSRAHKFLEYCINDSYLSFSIDITLKVLLILLTKKKAHRFIGSTVVSHFTMDLGGKKVPLKTVIDVGHGQVDRKASPFL